MNDEIQVHVVDYGNARNLMMRYTDPFTGKHVARSTRTRNRTAAERAAAKWEAELRDGRYQKPSRVTWADFREKYENEVLPSVKAGTAHKVNYVLDIVERVLNPLRVRDITTARLSYLQSELRKGQELKGRARRPCSPATVDSYLRTLRAALSVAVDWGYLPAVPKVRKEARAQAESKAKGRPIVAEEFERMILVVPKVVSVEAAGSWKHFLQGLWLSGLRLNEALTLYWDREDCPDGQCIEVDLSGRRPMLRIPAALDKGKRDRLLPITPDFAAFLAETPQDNRRGAVFAPKATRQHEGREWYRQRVSKTVAKIGRKAGVVVNDGGKCASAHDLRRSFGQRWAAKVMPHILMQLMRHQEIATTMNYYAGRDAEAAADVVWSAAGEPGNSLGNIQPPRPKRVIEGVSISNDVA